MNPPAWLQAIRQRCEAATGGTWRYEFREEGPPFHEEIGIVTSEGPVVNGHRHDAIVGTGYFDGIHLLLRASDAEFIANARTDLPALLDIAEALAGALELVVRDAEGCPMS